jgi:hypothetical protein
MKTFSVIALFVIVVAVGCGGGASETKPVEEPSPEETTGGEATPAAGSPAAEPAPSGVYDDDPGDHKGGDEE